MNNIIKSDSTFYDYEEETNIRVVSFNLVDFNKRFNTEIVLYYDDEYFTPYEASDLAEYFISIIPDLLFMKHNPFCNELDEWKEFIKFKVEELNNLKEAYQKEWFKILYKNYYPIGITDVEENKYYVINELNKIVNSI
ncbi:hypothetical protein HX096_12000 [Empedobacter falsenii]|uniref:hypothetical protein n=1 Tax=Empedobacter falsenii TaxID=343874 RepID=UPI0025755221|nr:hypothetical protein [Empedobacter falsenii]MDM1548575.1 hypothetical protein [Empedobacter falsenii]